MSHRISTLSVTPVRAEPSEKSEMISQILFGESFSIIEEVKGWSKIILDYDNYEGWIDNNMIGIEIDEKVNNKIIVNNGYLVSSFGKQWLSGGSNLPFFDKDEKRLSLNGITYDFNGNYINTNNKPKIDIKKFINLFLNTSYLWGGRSIWGIDCSGLVQLIYKMNNIFLPRDVIQQLNFGTPIPFVENIKEGDLAFFDNEEGNVIHVGICLLNNKIMHSHGYVRIDDLDHYGIFNKSTKKYSHTLRVIRRIVLD